MATLISTKMNRGYGPARSTGPSGLGGWAVEQAVHRGCAAATANIKPTIVRALTKIPPAQTAIAQIGKRQCSPSRVLSMANVRNETNRVRNVHPSIVPSSRCHDRPASRNGSTPQSRNHMQLIDNGPMNTHHGKAPRGLSFALT